MGNTLFGVDIAGIIADVVGPGVLEAVISKEVITGTRDPANLAGGFPQTPGLHVCRGFWESISATDVDGVDILKSDKRACLIGDTIPPGGMPVFGDEITIAGETRMVVKLLRVDPANALYEFVARDQAGPDAQ